MEILRLMVGDHSYLRADDEILEVFDRHWETSLRVPVLWLGVKPVPQSRQLLLHIGCALPPGPLLYGASIKAVSGSHAISAPWPQEPAVVDFFRRLAAQSGRTIQP